MAETDKHPKRAITLGGGGPAAGLHIGALEALRSEGIDFQVWSLSCIGAWVGIVYNQTDKHKEVEQTYEFFKNGVFRDDASYERFPINSVFGTDWFANTQALMEFIWSPASYQGLWQPQKMMGAVEETLALVGKRLSEKNPQWDRGDINRWILNQVLAPNPFVRYLMSMMYLSHVSGLSRINYPHSDFMKSIKFERLFGPQKPFIFHNAWSLDDQKLALFSNQPFKKAPPENVVYRGDISASTLCACSALPFVEETVAIPLVERSGTRNVTYCEGALVDTVNFESLLEEHPDLDEIWISRIVDAKQIRPQKNLHDALANLCQLFAATVGEDDVKLFKYHVRYPEHRANGWKGTVVEIHVPAGITFNWNHSNLDAGRALGRVAAEEAISAYYREGCMYARDNKTGTPRFINELEAKPKISARAA